MNINVLRLYKLNYFIINLKEMNKQVWRSGSAFGFQPESLGPIPSTCKTNILYIDKTVTNFYI